MSYPKKINPEILRLQLKLLKHENKLNELLLQRGSQWIDEVAIRIVRLQIRDIRVELAMVSQP